MIFCQRAELTHNKSYRKWYRCLINSVTQEEDEMTRGSILEYVEAIRGRYLNVSRKEKGRILDEFTNVTDLHRKAAIRLLRRRGQAKVRRKRGRPRCYGHDVVSALR